MGQHARGWFLLHWLAVKVQTSLRFQTMSSEKYESRDGLKQKLRPLAPLDSYIENTRWVSLISSLQGNALRMLVDIARLTERFNMRSQCRYW